MSLNISNVILVLGALYFHYAYGLESFYACLLILFALVLWSYHGFSDERKGLLKAEAEFYKAKAEYYREEANHIKTKD